MPHIQSHLDAYHARPEMVLARDYLETLQTVVEQHGEELNKVSTINALLVPVEHALYRPLSQHATLSDKDAGQYFFSPEKRSLSPGERQPMGIASINASLSWIVDTHRFIQITNKDLPATISSTLNDTLNLHHQKAVERLAEHAPARLHTFGLTPSELMSALELDNVGPAETIETAQREMVALLENEHRSLRLMNAYSYSKETSDATQDIYTTLDSLQRPDVPHFEASRVDIRHRYSSVTQLETDIYYRDAKKEANGDAAYIQLGSFGNDTFMAPTGEWIRTIADGEFVRAAHRTYYQGCSEQGVDPICRETPQEAAKRVIHNANIVTELATNSPFISKELSAKLMVHASEAIDCANRHGRLEQQAPAIGTTFTGSSLAP